VTSTNSASDIETGTSRDALYVQPDANHSISDMLQFARAAQSEWQRLAIPERLHVVQRFREILAACCEEMCQAFALPDRRPKDTVASEILPLADAARFLQRNACRILKPKRARRRDRPWWLGNLRVEINREPRGVVLIIGPRNYPLFLPGVQTLQALTAGNAVLWKPAPGSSSVAECFARFMKQAGLPHGLLHVLPEAPEAARAAIRRGVDLVVLTGSAETGRLVLHQAAETLTPTVMALSGCDAVFVRHDADLDLACRALCYGLQFNGSATCIAPRRVFVARTRFPELCRRLIESASRVAPVFVESGIRSRVIGLARAALAGGARLLIGELDDEGDSKMKPLILADTRPEMEMLQADIFAPVICLVAVDDDDQAVTAANQCPYALGAAIFGSAQGAESLARSLDVGCVVINDVIVPTADPRVPFAPRQRSGFGVTRGEEGLLEMTAIKCITTRERGPWRHLEPDTPHDLRILRSLLKLAHGPTVRSRLHGGFELLASIIQRLLRKNRAEKP